MYKASLICVSIYLVIVPFLQLPELNLFDSKRIFQLGLFVIIGFMICTSLFQKRNNNADKSLLNSNFVSSNSIIALLSVLIIAGLFSVLLSEHKEYAALDYVFFFLLLVIMFLMVPRSLRMHYFLGQTIFVTALLYTGLYLVIFFGNYISSYLDPMIIMWPEKLTFTIVIEGAELKGKEVLYFVNKRFFNHTQTWTLPVLTGLLVLLHKKRPKDFLLHLLLFLTVSFWWMLIFASGGRGSTVSLVSSLLIITVLFRKEAYTFVKYGCSTFIAGGVFYYLFFRLFTTDGLPMMRSTQNFNLRLELWEKATDLWMQNPFFGIGPLHFAHLIDSTPTSAHPHNFYLQFLTEWGFIAFLALAVLLFLAGRMVVRNYSEIRRNSPNRIIYISITWSMAAALIHAFVSGVMITPMSQMWFILTGAWLFGFTIRDSTLKNSFRRNNYMGYIYLLLLFIILYLTYGDILTLKNLYSEYINNFPDYNLNPRFWGQGLFE